MEKVRTSLTHDHSIGFISRVEMLLNKRHFMQRTINLGQKVFENVYHSVLLVQRLNFHYSSQRLSLNSTDKRIIRSSSPDIHIPNKTYIEFILEHCERHGEKHAIADYMNEKLFTYNDVHDLVKKCGSAFKRMGKNQKDVVALFMPNIPEYPIALYGIQVAGGTVTTVNPTYTADELAYQLNDTGAKYLVSSLELLPKAREATSKVKLSMDNVLDIDTLWNLILSDDGSYLPNIHSTKTPSEDVVNLAYSSGTTGLPKGVMLTSTNYISQAVIMACERFMPKRPEIPQEIILAFLPFFHAYGLAYIMGVHFYLGSKLICLPKFEPELFLDAIEKHKVTFLPLVPPIVLFLTKHPMVEKYDLSSVKYIVCSAAHLSGELEKTLLKRFPNVCSVQQGYGLTETGGGTMVNPLDKPPTKSGSIGILLPNTEAKVKDLQSGKALGPGEDGEICLRGPGITKGYLNNPEQIAQAIDQDGWLHTGDIGHYDEDEYFYIVDRKKELIKYKGLQVATKNSYWNLLL
ncbi:4-coumarate--CoA ligase 1-like [Actinia tenebrosa]|uniref:4-coumarate--CoA ligase 1-like n=1 Tax=Actinia tenebrosa TaxID=6105 RepID=A0A6P8IIK5_ACTTE|nr:4-coumarate--CoA ligase 1-like [Actinia tenebrosa]